MADAPDEDMEVEINPLPYPFVEEDDQKLRCFIAEHYLNAEIDGTILIENMNSIFSWIKDGKAPARSKKPTLVKSDA